MRNTTAIPGDDQNPTVVWRAFQNDADQGGSIYVPGGMGRYLIDRPIIVDVDGTVFESDGDAEILNTKSGGIFQLGLKRKPLSTDHWPNPASIRTCGDSAVAFQSTAWSKLARQMTISGQVTANAGWGSDQTPICGSMYNQEPGPWYILVVNGGTKVALLFKTNDGVNHVAYSPAFSGNDLSFKFDIDLDAGTVLYNGAHAYQFPAGSDWFECEQSLFQIGYVRDACGGVSPYDLTFHALALPWISLWKDQEPGDWVHAYGTDGHAVGRFLKHLDNGDTVSWNRLSDLKLTATTNRWGQTISIGMVYNAVLERLRVNNGEQCVGSIAAGVSYPVALRDCILLFAHRCGLYGYGMTLYATGTTFNYFSYAAAILRGSNASFSDTFVGDFKAKAVFKMLDARGNGGMYAFRGGLADFEGNSPECYWQVERHANTPITSLRVEDFALGKVAAEGVHVRLTDSVMAQGNPPSHCYAAIANVPAVDALRVEKADCWKVDMWG